MKNNRAIWRERLIIAGTCIVVLAGVPALLRFDRTHVGWTREASEDLADLSTSARKDVDANYQQFQENLTAADRAEMQRIHAMVAEDPKRAAVLDSFDMWFQHLTPFEREQIAESDSLEKQITVIQTLLAQQDAERDVVEVNLEERLLQFSAAGGRSRSEFDEIKEHVRNLREDLTPLQLTQFNVTTVEFDSMIDTVVNALPEEAGKAFRKSLEQRGDDAAPDVKRRMRVRALLSATRSLGRDYWRNRRAMFEEIAAMILSQLEDSELREKLKTLQPDQQATIAGAIVMRSVQHNLDLSPHFPDEAELKQFVRDLDRPEQIKLLGMQPEKAKIRANMKYVIATAPEDIAENAEQILYFIEQERGRRRPRGPGRDGSEDRPDRPPRPQGDRRKPPGPPKR